MIPEHPLKALLPILVTEFGTVIDVRPEQPEKASFPILVTEVGIVTEVRPEHSEKASFPILVTEAGIVIEVSPLQFEKAELPMLVIPSSNVIFFNSLLQYFVIQAGLTLLPHSNSLTSEQYEKAESSILVTELGMEKEVIL